MSLHFPDRDVRQRGLVPPDQLAKVHAVVIGTGAIGRQVALQLAALGVPRLTLFDDDVVSEENLAPQGFFASDLGRSKVLATGSLCRQIQPEIILKECPQRFLRHTGLPKDEREEVVVFCCVDSITTRKTIWESCQHQAALFVDGRMSAEVVRILALDQRSNPAAYRNSLFGEHEAYQGVCTSKSTIYSACVAAGLMMAQLARWLRRQPLSFDQQLNLLAAELTVTEAA